MMKTTGRNDWNEYLIWLGSGLVALHFVFSFAVPLLIPALFLYSEQLWWPGIVGLIVLLAGLIARYLKQSPQPTDESASLPGAAVRAAKPKQNTYLIVAIILLLCGLLFGSALPGIAGVALLVGHNPAGLKTSLHTTWGKVLASLVSSLAIGALLAALFLPMASLKQGDGFTSWKDFTDGAALSLLYFGPLFAIGALVILFPLLLFILLGRK
ncbi:hypothetical protein FJU30_17525 [Affinibrenneria salicis]|uniref:Uncharacterized protein n=1 Tax=Affinibrenneria salicis TaxID=2590031 RepID=A0A5J5FWS2_9GAMM|nr:hypothetical protein [Affinibrenneria salicis]KAA8998212.1 hypothetical protein FJU30_17525 [Affinibrenneria salicis]